MLANLLVLASSFLIINNNGPTYTVEKALGEHMEVRRYDSWIVAQTTVKGTHENAGSEAFHILAGYIFGANDQNAKIEMTAPVTQQQVGENEYLVQFFMPKGWTLESLPKPNDSRVNIRMLPERRILAERYIGGWSDRLYNENLAKINEQVKTDSMKVDNEPIWARYNSPMAPSFVRTNEIMYEIVV